MKLIRPDVKAVELFNSFWTPEPLAARTKLFADEEEIDIGKYINQFQKYKEIDDTISRNKNLINFLEKINKEYHTRVSNIQGLSEELRNMGIVNKNDLKENIKSGRMLLPKFVEICKKTTGNYTYSFATKVFSFIDDKYPIMDSFVVTLLDSYEYDGKIPKSKWGDYKKYIKNYRLFKDSYGLNDCSNKEIDRFLWTYGKILADYWSDMGVLNFEPISFDTKTIGVNNAAVEIYNLTLKKFIDTYRKYYYNVSPEEKSFAKKTLGLTINPPADSEHEIMCYKNLGEQNIKTIAWRMGGEITEEGIKTRYRMYPVESINAFIENVKRRDLPIKNKSNLSTEDIRISYDEILQAADECGLSGYGGVDIICSMYFLSKGNVPIYDYYANVAVRALLSNKSPQEIYVDQASGQDEQLRDDKKLAVDMLIEYQDLLTELTEGTEFYRNDGFIPRDLDRALWVYGHATKQFKMADRG